MHALVVMHRRTLYENVDSAKIKVPFILQISIFYAWHRIIIHCIDIDPYRLIVTPLIYILYYTILNYTILYTILYSILLYPIFHKILSILMSCYTLCSAEQRFCLDVSGHADGGSEPMRS